MGLFGGLFGGSKTVVTQQAANNTTVDVEIGIENVLDMEPIAKVLEWLGLKEAETAKVVSAQSASDAASLVQAMQEKTAAELIQKQTVINQVLPWFRLVAGAVVLYLGIKIFNNWKG